MAMSLGGIGATHPVPGSTEPLAAAAPGLTKRERKRKSDAKANLAANNAAVNTGGHSLTRDERKALALGLPITVQVSVQAYVADSLSILRSNLGKIYLMDAFLKKRVTRTLSYTKYQLRI